MQLDNNPLKQYFRRPSIHLRLPSRGLVYTPDIIEIPETGELPVFPMTAIDDITTKTPDALYNGSAVVDIIKSCIPCIKDPWRLINVDLDAVLIAIKSASQGNELSIDSVCPHCSETHTYGVNLTGILSTLKMPDYSKELQVGDLSIRFRPLQYREMNEASISQFEMQRVFLNIEQLSDQADKAQKMQEAIKHITEITMKIVAKTIEYIKTPTSVVDNPSFIFDFIQHCDNNTYVAVRDYHSKIKTLSEMQPLKVACSNCSHQYEQPFTLNSSDFFG